MSPIPLTLERLSLRDEADGDVSQSIETSCTSLTKSPPATPSIPEPSVKDCAICLDAEVSHPHGVCLVCHDGGQGLPASPHAFGHTLLTKAQLEASVENACNFCSLVHNSFSAMGWQIREHLCLDTQALRDHGPLVVWTSNNIGLFGEKPIGLEIFTQTDPPSSGNNYQTCRAISYDSSSDDCMLLAKQWIQECVSSHTACAYKPSPLPKRVIFVGTTEKDPYLYVSQDEEDGVYATLSHCWGSSTNHPPKTLTTTEKDAMVGISFAGLPKTFQDAIVITRELGLEYLWIDSLCILQDSAGDWLETAAKMGAIYANSYVTIAAADAKNCHEGCFLEHNKAFKQCEVPLPAGMESKGTVYARAVPSLHSMDNWILDETTVGDSVLDGRTALDGRAWVFQERTLSPRTLHYTAKELVFECKEHLRCECRGRPRPAPPDNKASPAMLERQSRAESLFQWMGFIEEYTARQLTFDDDWLPAIAGTAAIVAGRMGGEYRAGLWKQDLLLHLLWYASEKYPRDETLSKHHERDYAPSWSWASVIGRKTFVWKKNYSYHPNPIDVLTQKAEILDISAEPVDAKLSPYGAVKTGSSMRVRGLLCPGRIEYSPLRDSTECVDWRPSADVGLHAVTVQPDVPAAFRRLATAPDTTFYLLPLCAKFEDKNPEFGTISLTGFTMVYGLVVVADGESHKRVGYFEFEPGNMYGWVLEWAMWEDLGTEREIQIV